MSPDQQDDGKAATYVVVSIDGNPYCLDVRQVSEIVSDVKITPVPGSPPIIRGVINVRGRVLALGDLSVALGGGGVTDAAAPVLVLDAVLGEEMAVLVDDVCDVIAIPAERLQPPPPFGLGGAAPHASAVAELESGLAVVLDLETVLKPAADGPSEELEDGVLVGASSGAEGGGSSTGAGPSAGAGEG